MSVIKKGIKTFGLPRIIILTFFILLIIVSGFYKMDLQSLISDVIRRWAMYGILVLAMVPSIQSGIGPNFGVSLGISGGLLGCLISIELRYMGFYNAFAHNKTLFGLVGVAVALLLAVLFSSVFGVLYGMLLNRVKGSEMTISTYVGFSVVALMNIVWLLLPFKSPTSIWPLAGEGLRNTINLADDFAEVFNNLWGFDLGFISPSLKNIYIPTGLIIVFVLACVFVWLFSKSRTGIAMAAAGANPVFAKASGINVNKMRILGTSVSTALGGIGIVAYAQSYGFVQLYNAPLMMGFACVAAVLIGGASVGRARIWNVLLGTFLFQGILAVALPVANNILPESNLSEIFRIIISNGIILYALTKAKEDGK
ncbi:MAG: ABC transporter permease subunit [Oscillospiraceae bacterium]